MKRFLSITRRNKSKQTGWNYHALDESKEMGSICRMMLDAAMEIMIYAPEAKVLAGLSYRREFFEAIRPAPRIAFIGKDSMYEKIRKAAILLDIFSVEQEPLAKTLVSLFEEGEAISKDLFQPIAKMMAAERCKTYKVIAKQYKEKAEQGDAEAQYKMGYFGATSQDCIKWMGASADSGYSQAQYYIGMAYEHGKCVARDLELAKRMYRMAAEQGDQRAAHAFEQLS